MKSILDLLKSGDGAIVISKSHNYKENIFFVDNKGNFSLLEYLDIPNIGQLKKIEKVYFDLLKKSKIENNIDLWIRKIKGSKSYLENFSNEYIINLDKDYIEDINKIKFLIGHELGHVILNEKPLLENKKNKLVEIINFIFFTIFSLFLFNLMYFLFQSKGTLLEKTILLNVAVLYSSLYYYLVFKPLSNFDKRYRFYREEVFCDNVAKYLASDIEIELSETDNQEHHPSKIARINNIKDFKTIDEIYLFIENYKIILKKMIITNIYLKDFYYDLQKVFFKKIQKIDSLLQVNERFKVEKYLLYKRYSVYKTDLKFKRPLAMIDNGTLYKVIILINNKTKIKSVAVKSNNNVFLIAPEHIDISEGVVLEI